MFVVKFEGVYLREHEDDRYLQFTHWIRRAKRFATFERAYRYVWYAMPKRGTEIYRVYFGCIPIRVWPKGDPYARD